MERHVSSIEYNGIFAAFHRKGDRLGAGLGADDFADYLAVVKGVYAYIGTHSDDDPNTGVPQHHGLFDIDESTMLISCNLYVDYALEYLKGKIGNDR